MKRIAATVDECFGQHFDGLRPLQRDQRTIR